MTDFLVRHFVPNYSAVENTAVRTSYGILAGVTGIFCNFLLFAIKLVTGLVLRSVSVTARRFQQPFRCRFFHHQPDWRAHGGKNRRMRRALLSATGGLSILPLSSLHF